MAIPTYQVHGTSRPFSASRDLLVQLFDSAARDELVLPLRPIFHGEAPKTASLSDRQAVGEQLRFYTRQRCLRDFRAVAWRISQRHPDGFAVRVAGVLNAADGDFFEVIGTYVPMEIAFSPSATYHATESDDAEYLRVIHGLNSDEEWQSFRSSLGTYLNAGDSWTAVWLAEAVLQRSSLPPPDVCHRLGLAFGLQDRTVEAERLFARWGEASPLNRARSNYSLAMLYARHHPPAWRDEKTAERLLEEAWEVLCGLDQDDQKVVYESVFNRNGLALLIYRRRRYDEAADLLERAIARLESTRFVGGVHHTVLTNNLGRVYAAAGKEEPAERWLQAAIEIDPTFSEYWFDLATFYADAGRDEEALEAATEAARLSAVIADAPALMAFLHLRAGRYLNAVEQYARAWEIEPFRADFALGAAYAASQADDYRQVSGWLGHLKRLTLSLDEREQRDLLDLEAATNLDHLDEAEVRRRLNELRVRYPSSEMILENLQALREFEEATHEGR